MSGPIPSSTRRSAPAYYARVIEIPTPRWTAYEAKRFGITMKKEIPMVTRYLFQEKPPDTRDAIETLVALLVKQVGLTAGDFKETRPQAQYLW